MRPGKNQLLMLLVGAMLAGCASQTERSSSGSGSTQTQTQTPATEFQPEAENVQLVDRALDPVPEQPIQDIGPQPDRSVSGPSEEQAAAKPDLVSGPSGAGDESDEVDDIGAQPDESGTEQYEEEQRLAMQSAAGAPTAAGDDADDVEDVGTQADESGTEQYEEEQRLARQKLVADPNTAAEESDEVADLGTQPDESGTVQNAEEQRMARQDLVGSPTAPAEEAEEVADVGTQADASGTVKFPEESRQTAQVVGAPTQVITVSAEAEPLFGFNQAVIRPDQFGELNDLVASLKGAQYKTIEVVGHADRIGSARYNQRLSEKRARAVKAYLVGKGIPAKKIVISGRGKNEPQTGTMCDNRKGKDLISCLQPDRRVEVKVSATKQMK